MKARMMPSRMRLPASEVTVPMVSLSICPKPQMISATPPTRAAITPSSMGWKRLMRCQAAVMMIPASVATVVASRMGMKTSVGWAAP